jgi:hypothetical protein
MHDEGMDAAKPAKGFSQRLKPTPRKDPNQLMSRPGWIRQRTKEIKNCANADLTTGTDSMTHRSMKRRSKQKAKSDFSETTLDQRRGEFDLRPERLKHISAADRPGHRAIAVLRHTQPRARRHERGRRRDVKGLASISSCAAGIQDISGCANMHGSLAHYPGGAGNLTYSFSLDMQPSQQCADLRWRRLAVHNFGGDIGHFLLRKITPSGYPGNRVFDCHGHS